MTSDGNNNEGQLIFDYGNEAADRQDGKAVFNASDAVWFVFASNLYEACQAMFNNREGATSRNGKWHNAWNASAYHAYLLSEQRKVPERVWNECYWYDYLRTYETGKVHEASDEGQIIDKSWITFLDGGQKTHQRWHYETFEELYDASKYRSNYSTSNSITLRGYTPDDGDPSLEAVPAKSEISIKMYNKCYLTAHFGNNIKTQKVQKGVLTTLQFLEANNEYMRLSDTVINVDTASMIQEIGDLAPLYPGQASFSAATRLRSIKIGDSTPGYNNPHITNTETGTVDFGANYMLEHLEVQNLSNANQPLNLSGCPALAYLDARGSSFTSVVFANGGLLNEAYLNNPSNLVMRNLDFLTNANFSVTDLTAVKQLRLEGCKLFDTRTFIESLDLNILRLTGIDWTVDDDEPILNNLLSIMGMDELGYTVPQSYLSGTVSLTGVVYSGIRDGYAAAWPDLEIDTSNASQIVAQHLVTYMDENGETVLYTKYINNGNSIVDVVATGECAAPTKVADIQYRYTFGDLQYGSYIPYSGWRYSADSQSIYSIYGNNVPAVQSTTTVYAVYSTSPQQYVVRWLVGSKVIATSDLQNYGGGYGLSAPTIKEVKAADVDTYSFQDNGNGTCNYRIMTGWEKLPTNIQPTSATGTYDIQATWLERTNVNIAAMLTSNDYSVEEKLLVLKSAQSARNTLNLQDMYPVKLGYTGVKPAIDLLAAPKRYTGIADAPIAAYTPFNANTSFTMAIDYRFEHVVNDQANEAVLVSCYDDSGTTTVGFKLFYDLQAASPVPQISFGSTDSIDESNVKKIGTSLQYRGMVVLRHRAGEPTLTIYSGSNSNGLINNYVADEFRQGITLANVPSSNAKIILGGVNSSSTTSVNASGTIYAVKYWEEDLGEGECMQLANWCYETAHFAVQDFTGYTDPHSALPISNANLVLHTLNASEMGNAKDVAIQSSESSVGWDPSLLRTFYNGRLYQALPIKLQSIINLTPIIHVKANKTTNGYVISNNTSTTQDYVFASSHKEAFGTIAAYVGETGGTTSFGWGGLIIRQWSGSSFLAPYSDTSSYINLRFPYYPIAIGSTTKIFVGYPVVNGSFETYARNNSLGLTTGDILIPEDSLVAYIYIGSTDIQNGAPFVRNSSNTALNTSSGAWIESSSWWLRSVSTDATNGTGIQSNRSRFTFISPLGNATTGRTFNNGIVYSIAL